MSAAQSRSGELGHPLLRRQRTGAQSAGTGRARSRIMSKACPRIAIDPDGGRGSTAGGLSNRRLRRASKGVPARCRDAGPVTPSGPWISCALEWPLWAPCVTPAPDSLRAPIRRSGRISAQSRIMSAARSCPMWDGRAVPPLYRPGSRAGSANNSESRPLRTPATSATLRTASKVPNT